MIQLGNKVNLIDQLDSELPESVSVLVEFNGKKAIILAAYAPPRYDKQLFIEILAKELEHFAQRKLPMIVTGVLNIETIKKKSKARLSRYI